MTRPTLVSAHARVHDNLPWFIAGTLDEDSMAEVRKHLAECEMCRRDYAMETRIAELMRRESVVDLAPQSALGRLLERIDSHEERRRWRARLKSWFVTPGHRVLIATVGIQAIAIVALVGVLVTLTYPSQEIAAYRTLTRVDAPRTEGAQLVRVVFAEDLPAGALRRMVSAAGTRIIDGPGVNGIFTLTPDPALAGHQAEQIAEGLRAQPGVRFAEVVSPAGP